VSLRLVVAGGGTGGHLYPGLAVAEEVRARGGEVLFVGTSRGIEARAVPAAGYPLELLEVSGLKRMGLANTLRGLMRLPIAVLRARSIVRTFRPDVVLGVGGYASGPVGLAAASARVPLALQEQNSVPGMTNRFLGRFARRVFVGFDDAARLFPRGRSVATGNPVRRAFVDAVAARAGHAPADRQPRLLVVGGSQGARAVNELVVDALARLAAQGRLPPVLHQSGAADEARTRERYASLAWPAEQTARVDVRPFLDDMVGAYDAAALVVARAGALTLAELAVLGKPAILIPLPTAADDHQTKNADAFARAGAAVLFSQTTGTADALAALIAELLADATRLARMGAAMRSLGKPDAARAIADELASLARA
jgi:UDP-N-acetylglucosamine--N-acetylmuramyl-(pentapeptide) pyrophosphoryl-undecaprenol N-acetylglucosamine transferase